MVSDKGAAGASNTEPHRSELPDRERMTEKALSEIRQIGSAAAITKCRGLANQIETKILQSEPDDFPDPSAVEEVLAYLQRAAAVLKKL
jgi:hypothetical protein